MKVMIESKLYNQYISWRINAIVYIFKIIISCIKIVGSSIMGHNACRSRILRKLGEVNDED